MRRTGFTLLEVLVAVVIVGLTITAFFELLTGSLKLERKVEEKLGLEITAREAFTKLLALDPREEDFPWEGTADGKWYEISLFPVELAPDKDVAEEQEVTLRLEQELFGYEFTLFENEEKTKGLRLVQYKEYSRGHFTEAFLAERLKEAPEARKGLSP